MLSEPGSALYTGFNGPFLRLVPAARYEQVARRRVQRQVIMPRIVRLLQLDDLLVGVVNEKNCRRLAGQRRRAIVQPVNFPRPRSRPYCCLVKREPASYELFGSPAQSHSWISRLPAPLLSGSSWNSRMRHPTVGRYVPIESFASDRKLASVVLPDFVERTNELHRFKMKMQSYLARAE